MDSKNIRKLKYPTTIIGSIVLLLSLSLSIAIKPPTPNLQSKTENKPLPKTISFKNQDIGFLLNHYQALSGFRTKTMVSMKINYGKGPLRTTATVIVTNKSYQQLIYQVSTNSNKNWNGLIPFKNGTFYKLYEFYPKIWYTTQPPHRKNVHILKSASYFDEKGNPLAIKDSKFLVFKTVYLITKAAPIENKLMHIDRTSAEKRKIIGGKKDLVTRIRYDSRGKETHRVPISTLTFWHIHRQQYYLRHK